MTTARPATARCSEPHATTQRAAVDTTTAKMMPTALAVSRRVHRMLLRSWPAL